jgi:hypothetical protein
LGAGHGVDLPLRGPSTISLRETVPLPEASSGRI